MIFNEDLIFIHIGKTGGLSCARFLLRNLERPVFSCHRHARLEKLRLGLRGVTPITCVNRHCSLAEALELIKTADGRGLSDFKKVIAVIRHPYTLELSFYKHLQIAQVRRRRRGQKILELADGDFHTFVREAGYHRPGFTQEKFVQVDGDIADSVELVRFEELEHSFPAAVEPFRRHPGFGYEGRFPHRNASTPVSSPSSLLTAEVKESIYHKHRFMFDSGLYQR